MGPQVKTGTHSVRRGTPSVPVGALAGGEPCHPSSFPLHPSIPPSVHPLAVPPSRWSAVLNHPGMRSHSSPPPFLLSSLSLSLRPVTNSTLAPPSFPSHSASFRLASTHLSLPFLSISNQSSIYDTSGKIIKLSYICDEPSENKGYCFNCQPMTSNYAYQCISLIFGENEVN